MSEPNLQDRKFAYALATLGADVSFYVTGEAASGYSIEARFWRYNPREFVAKGAGQTLAKAVDSLVAAYRQKQAAVIKLDETNVREGYR